MAVWKMEKFILLQLGLEIEEENINAIDRYWNETELAVRRVLSRMLPRSTKMFVKKKILRIM